MKIKIPETITREHILLALKEIDKNNYPREHRSNKFDLFHDGKQYPPKWVIRTANIFDIGSPLDTILFSGGNQANRFLQKRGFIVIERSTSSSEKRPPNWTREELILSLDLYFKLFPNHFEETDPQIIELSLLLNKMADSYNLQKTEKFRNPVGVKSKLNNFLFLDTGKGRSNVSNNDKLIWKEFSNNPEKLRQEAKIIRLGIEEKNIYPQSSQYFLDQEASDFPEGNVCYSMHKRRERNTKFIKNIKKNAEKMGLLFCEVCGFDFHHTYGNIGKGFIECHHLKPLSEYDLNEKTNKENLVFLCSNCHKVVHKYRPWLGRNELKNILKKD